MKVFVSWSGDMSKIVDKVTGVSEYTDALEITNVEPPGAKWYYVTGSVRHP